MIRGLTFALCVCFMVFGLITVIQAQDPAARSLASVSIEGGNKEQDGLNGPVRRVRSETARIMIKDGKMSEGPREVRSITTYDPKGLKIDSVAYPMEGGAVLGREQYQYDAKGNIVQMTLRGDDGAILTKETYEYEFDELGNWKKMTSSVAVYENGKVSYEPIEVTYRTITYYYGQAVDKLAATPKTNAGDKTTVAPLTTSASKVSNPPTTRKSAAASSKAKPEVSSPPPMTEKKVASGESSTPGSDNKPATEAAHSTVSERKANSDQSAPTTPDAAVAVNYVTEEILKDAAITLPKPDYPSGARLTRAGGTVEVHVIVDEKGEVVTARSMSGHPLLKDAAEAAARKATFSRAKLSSEPGRIYGIINYDFGTPPAEASLVTNNASNAAPTEVEKVPVREVASNPVSSTPQSTPVNADSAKGTSPSEPTAARYERALTYLNPGSSSDNLAVLKEAIQRNPNDGSAYRKLGIAYAGQGQNREAVAVFKMAIKISPELLDAQSYLHLGHAYLELGKNSDALKAFKQAVYLVREQALDAEGKAKPNTPNPVELHYSLSLAHYRLGHYQEAISELKEVIELNPKSAEAYYALAISYIAINDQRSAQKQLSILTPLNKALAEKLAAALGKNAPSRGCLTIACRVSR